MGQGVGWWSEGVGVGGGRREGGKDRGGRVGRAKRQRQRSGMACVMGMKDRDLREWSRVKEQSEGGQR